MDVKHKMELEDCDYCYEPLNLKTGPHFQIDPDCEMFSSGYYLERLDDFFEEYEYKDLPGFPISILPCEVKLDEGKVLNDYITMTIYNEEEILGYGTGFENVLDRNLGRVFLGRFPLRPIFIQIGINVLRIWFIQPIDCAVGKGAFILTARNIPEIRMKFIVDGDEENAYLVGGPMGWQSDKYVPAFITYEATVSREGGTKILIYKNDELIRTMEFSKETGISALCTEHFSE